MGNNKKDLLSGNLFKKILLFALPVMFSGILQLLFNACDLIVVGGFAGDQALAAVGATGALTSLIVNLFIGFSVGANVAVARAIGKKNKDRSHDVVHTSILFSFIIGIILTIFGVVSARKLLIMIDTNAEILDMSTTYLTIYFSGMIFNMLYNFGASIVRATGETKKPLYYLIIAGVINVLLNLFFVLVLGMDVDGVAIATISSQMISAILILRYLIKTDNEYVKLNIKCLKIDRSSLSEIILIGLPAGIQSSLFAISNVIIQKGVNSFESTALVAGNSASNNIGGFIYTSMNAFYQACITFTSQNFGANKINNCKKVLLYCLLDVVVIGLFVGSLAVLFGEPLLDLYANGEDAISYGMRRLTIVGLSYFLCGMADVAVGGLRGLGHSVAPMIISVGTICGARILWVNTVFEANHTLEILMLSYPVSWLLAAIIQLIYYACVYRTVKRQSELVYNN